MNLVILDDDLTIRIVLKQLLSRLLNNVTIYTSNDGLQGLGHILVVKPDVVILDTTLPKYSGLELVEYISTNKVIKDKATKIIVIHEDSHIPQVPDDYVKLNKRDPQFLTKLLVALGASVKSLYFRLLVKLGARVLTLANRSDVISRKSITIFQRVLFALPWLVNEVITGIHLTLFYLLSGRKMDEENVAQKHQDLKEFRSRYYPALAVVVATTSIILLQVILLLAGGMALLNFRITSVFAVALQEVTLDANNSSYDSTLVEVVNGEVRLKPQVTTLFQVPEDIVLPPPEPAPAVEDVPEVDPTENPSEVLGAESTTPSNEVTTIAYSSSNPVIIFNQAVQFNELVSLLEESNFNNQQTSIQNDGNIEVTPQPNGITYQLSPDQINWYYYSDEAKWEKTTNEYVSSNSVQVINRYLDNYVTQVGGGEVYLRAFLHSDGNTQVALTRLTINRDLEIISEIAPIHTEEVSARDVYTEVALPAPTIFTASYYEGNKVIYGKLLATLSDTELANYKVRAYYTSSTNTQAEAENKFDFIGETGISMNQNNDIFFLLIVPNQPGGYVTAELVHSVIIEDEDVVESVSPLSKPIENSTFTIDSTGDQADSSLDGVCLTSAATCTLRAAIAEANNVAGADNIYFNIPTSDAGYRDYDTPNTVSSGDSTGGDDYWTIAPATVLPTITTQVILDGGTQTANQGDFNTNGPEVEIKGTGVSGINCLTLTTTASSSVSGFVINNCAKGINISSNTNQIKGNYFGTDIKGAAAIANANGITLNSPANGNIIGGTNVSDRNIISGSTGTALIIGTGSTGATFTEVYNNYFGTDRTGLIVIANDSCIYGGPAKNSIIGNGASTGRNVFLGCNTKSLQIQIGSNDNTIKGNYFGFGSDGVTSYVPSSSYFQMHIDIDSGSSFNMVGGPNLGDRNYINVANLDPIWIWDNATHDNTVENNYIGVNINGVKSTDLSTAPLYGQGNFRCAVVVGNTSASSNNIIRGNLIIPSNGTCGIYALKGTGTIIEKNTIGNSSFFAIVLYGMGSTTVIRNNFIGSSANQPGGVDPYFGFTTPANEVGISLNGSSPLVYGNKVVDNTKYGIYNTVYSDGGTYARTDVSNDLLSRPDIGGTSALTGSLCGGLESNCISNNTWAGVYSLDSIPDNETTLWTDNNFTGGNGVGGNTNIEQLWYGLFEVLTSTARRTDTIGATVNFPPGTKVRTGENPATTEVTSGVTANLTCVTAAECPASVGASPGNTSGVASNTSIVGPAGALLANETTWYRVVEYSYDSAGVKTNYNSFKFDSSHFASNTFTFDANSTTNAINTGTSRTISSQTYTDRAEPWTDKPAATRNIATGDLGRFQIMEVEYVDANPVNDGSGNYTITIDSTEDFGNGTITYFDDGSGTASGGVSNSTTNGLANGKTSLREAILAANNRSGFDNISFSIPTSDVNYIAPSGGVQGYWNIAPAVTYNVTDSSGLYINGYSQSGTSRNTAAFGQTIDTLLAIRVSCSCGNIFTISVGNNHFTGLNLATSNGSVLFLNGSNNNWIEGSFMGTDITGSSGSLFGKMQINNSSNNIIGTNGDGTGDIGERNLMAGSSGNQMIGIEIGTNNNNVVAGNYFGVDKTGRACTSGSRTRAIVQFFNGSNNRAGTNYDGVSDSEESNIIACITSDVRGHVRLNGTNGLIQGNYIGTNPQGDNLATGAAIPGIVTSGGVVGYTIKGNVIAYNGSHGIDLGTSSATNTITQNIIHHNAINGVLSSGGNGNIISQNTIYSNTGTGISQTGTGITNSYIENVIYSNTGFPLDLGASGANANDVGDSDTGANNLMNSPLINKVTYLGSGQYKFEGLIDNAVSGEGAFDLEICESDNHVSGHGGCIDTLFYQTDYVAQVSGGINPWVVEITIPGDDGTQNRIFTSLVTNSNGSTSEFSSNFEATASNPDYSIASYPIALVTPVNVIDNPQPLLDWHANGDSDLLKYEVYLDGLKIAETAHNVTQYQYVGENLSGLHTWKVVGKRVNASISGESINQTFEIQISTTLGLVSPVNGAVIDTKLPLLDWNADQTSNVNSYDIYLDEQYYATTYNKTATQYQVINELEERQYTWQVIAYFRGVNDEGIEEMTEIGRSAMETFVVKLVPMAAPGSTLVNPPTNYPLYGNRLDAETKTLGEQFKPLIPLVVSVGMATIALGVLAPSEHIGVFIATLLSRKKRNWGKVYDTETNQPLALAHVRLYTSAGVLIADTISDLGGYYAFPLEQSGKYHINVDLAGYHKFMRSVTIEAKNQEVQDIPLSRNLTKTDSMVYLRRHMKGVLSALNAILLVLMLGGFVYTLSLLPSSPTFLNFLITAAYLVVLSVNGYILAQNLSLKTTSGKLNRNFVYHASTQ
jgi:CheY-like chemotaxis protein